MGRYRSSSPSVGDEMGYIHCADIQEKVIFGRNMDPGASEAHSPLLAVPLAGGLASEIKNVKNCPHWEIPCSLLQGSPITRRIRLRTELYSKRGQKVGTEPSKVS